MRKDFYTFENRYSEHFNSFLNEKGDSNYANYLNFKNHNFITSFHILRTEGRGLKLLGTPRN